MNPISIVNDIAKAISYPFRMVFVVGLCFLINYFTSPGHWWFQWVAFGMGIGLIAVWARALRSIGAAAVTAGIAYAVYCWLQRRKASSSASNPAS